MKQDAFRDALVAALADELDVETDRIELKVTLDGEPVPASNLPATLSLVASEDDDAAQRDGGSAPDETDDVEAVAGPDAAPEESPAPEARGGRATGRSGARAPKSVADEDGDAGSDAGSDADRDGASTSSGASNGQQRESVMVTAEEIDQEAEAAADLLEGLLDAMDLPGDLRISVQEAHAEVEVIGLEEGVLIGRRGQTLDAVQELVRTAMQRRFERRSRVLVDVDGYRARRLEKLLERADEAVQEVLDTGESQRLEPMDSIERRLVHQRVAETEGVVSNSHGREPSRRIVIDLAD